MEKKGPTKEELQEFRERIKAIIKVLRESRKECKERVCFELLGQEKIDNALIRGLRSAGYIVFPIYSGSELNMKNKIYIDVMRSDPKLPKKKDDNVSQQ